MYLAPKPLSSLGLPTQREKEKERDAVWIDRVALARDRASEYKDASIDPSTHPSIYPPNKCGTVRYFDLNWSWNISAKIEKAFN